MKCLEKKAAEEKVEAPSQAEAPAPATGKKGALH